MANIADTFIDYLKASRAEMQKVKWPTRQETLRQTGVVIALSIIVSLFLGLADVVYQAVLKQII